MIDSTSADQNEIAYRKLVDATCQTLRDSDMSLEELYTHFSLPHCMPLSQKCVTAHLYSQIVVAFDSSQHGAEDGVQLKTLKHQLLLRHFADGEQLNPYLELLNVLIDAVRAHGWLAPPLKNEESWSKALAAAADYLVVRPCPFGLNDDNTRRQNQRKYAVAKAIKELRRSGYIVAIANGTAEIEHQEQIRIADCIEAYLAEAGGLEVAASIFNSLKRSYDPLLERYHIPRRTSTIGRDGGPSIPFSYLLNLCVKHTGTRTANHAQAEMAAQSAYALATAYAATFDVEPYNTFETLFHAGSNLPRFLMEIAVYDGMFNLAQARPGWIEKTLRSLFDWLDDDTAHHHLGWTIGQAARVACEIANITSGQSGPHILTHSSLAKGLSELPSTALTSILSIFSHRAGDANREYKLPYEQTKVDFWFKPLIEHSPGTYILMDRVWCAPAFYEAVVSAVRSKVPSADGFIGLAFERLVKAELEAHGVRVVSGTYNIGSQEGECDAVIETADRILFVEMKKKPLTRKSRSGIDINIFYDLSESLLAAMCQIGRHEILLCKHGSLELQDGSDTYTIERNGRAVERVALSPVEFGGLQDRGVISQVLKTMTTSKLSAVDASNDHSINKVQKKGQELLEQYKELAKIQSDPNGATFMNCWFLSLGQFLAILQGVSSNDSFQSSLFTTRHIMMGSLDFYFEHAQGLALKAGRKPQ